MTPAGDDATTPVPANAGIGLRGGHYDRVEAERPDVAFLEVHTENYFGRGGVPHDYLERLARRYPISFHGVGLSLGSTDPIDGDHLDRIVELVRAYRPGLVSEHLSWSSVDGVFTNDLLPYPLTAESLDHFCRRVDQVQARLERRILVENPSTYLAFTADALSETDFLNALAKRTGCGILLDVNNVFVCANNHGFDADAYLDAIDGQAVGEIHLAGHVENRFDDGSILIDSHNRPVCDAVWRLFRRTVQRLGPRPTLIEWDTELPDLDVLVQHAAQARSIIEDVRADAA